MVSGGTKNPITKRRITKRLNMLDVLDPVGMKQRLEEKSMMNFLKVIRESVRKSGYLEEDISYLAMLHMKKSAHEYVLKELGLSGEQSIYLENYGHIGQIDQILSLELALKAGKVKDGDLVVFVSAGIGYAWGATTIKWERVIELVNVVMKEVLLPNGETLAYREREGGETKVLLIHGNMTSSKHWDLVLDNMDAKYKLYAVDLRGFGASTYNNLIQSIKDFSDDVKLFVDEIGLKDFALVGWSTGGAVAMQFVADYSGYCNKLILLESESTRGYPFDGKMNVNDESRRFTLHEEIKADILKTIPVQIAYDTNNTELLKLIWNAVIYTHKQPEPELYDEYVQDMRTQRNLAEVHHSNNTFNISHHHNGLVEGTGKWITLMCLCLFCTVIVIWLLQKR